MPRIRPDQLTEAFRLEGAAALPVSRVCDALARTGGLYDPAAGGEEVRRSARSRPDLFFLLEPAAGWSIGSDTPATPPDSYHRALGAATGEPEPRVVLLADAAPDASPEVPPIRGVVLTLWDGALRDPAAEAELANAMRDAVEIDGLLAAAGPQSA